MSDADTPDVPPYLCFAWVAPAIWPHAVPNIGAIRTTQDRDQVTCPSCLHALGSQKHDTPVGLFAYCENGDCRVVIYLPGERADKESVDPALNCPGCGRFGRLKDKPTRNYGDQDGD